MVYAQFVQKKENILILVALVELTFVLYVKHICRLAFIKCLHLVFKVLFRA